MKRVGIGLLTLVLALWLSLGGGTLRAAEEKPAAEAAKSHEVVHEGSGIEEAPELIRGPDAGLVTSITTLIVFGVLLAVLGKYAWGPIATGLKAREDKIRNDIADAEAARKRAAETLEQYNKQLATAEQQVRDILTRAAADAEKIATNVKMQAQQEAEEIKERATKDIDAARKQALADIYAQAAELSTNIAAKILRRNLNADDQRDLVNSSLDQLQTVGGKV